MRLNPRLPLWPVLAVALAVTGRASGDGDPETGTPAAIDPLLAGLAADARGARDIAEAAARTKARTDPEGVHALFGDLGLRGRRALLRAMAAAGTKKAAELALTHAGDADPEVFQALLEGLVIGGAKSMSAKLPAGLADARRAPIDDLRLRWRVEGELVRLKSPSGQTGQYTGQFAPMKKRIGIKAVPVLLDILTDRQRPIGRAGGAGPYEPIHPGMIRYEPDELRSLTAHGFGQLLSLDDDSLNQHAEEIARYVVRLIGVFEEYWRMDWRTRGLEKMALAPKIAFSLWDLGITDPADRYVRWMESRERNRSLDRIERASAMWELGFIYIRLGRHEEGEQKYLMILANDYLSTHVAAYNLACNYAMRSMQEPQRKREFQELATHFLDRAVFELGFLDWRWMHEDRDLDAIRNLPGYKRVYGYLRSKYPGRKKHRVAKTFEELVIPGIGKKDAD
ncbi:MAG: hypothetical protein V3T86_00685 [Planctomycetota bacterium]